MVRLTKKTLRSMHKGYGSLNRAQLEVLGVPWPPPKGWRKALMGVEITDNEYQRVLALNGKGHAQRPAKPRKPKAQRPKRIKCSVCGYPKPRCEYLKANRNPPKCNRCVKGLPPKPSRGPQPAGSRKAREHAAHRALDAEMDRAIAGD